MRFTRRTDSRQTRSVMVLADDLGLDWKIGVAVFLAAVADIGVSLDRAVVEGAVGRSVIGSEGSGDDVSHWSCNRSMNGLRSFMSDRGSLSKSRTGLSENGASESAFLAETGSGSGSWAGSRGKNNFRTSGRLSDVDVALTFRLVDELDLGCRSGFTNDVHDASGCASGFLNVDHLHAAGTMYDSFDVRRARALGYDSNKTLRLCGSSDLDDFRGSLRSLVNSDNLIRAGVLLNSDDGLGAVSVDLVESGFRGPRGDNGTPMSSRGLFQRASLGEHSGGTLNRAVTHGPMAP